MLLVNRNLFVSYHFTGGYDDHGQPDLEGWGNCTLHVAANVLKDEEGVQEIEAEIAKRLTEDYGTRTEVVLINYKWMGD